MGLGALVQEFDVGAMVSRMVIAEVEARGLRGEEVERLAVARKRRRFLMVLVNILSSALATSLVVS